MATIDITQSHRLTLDDAKAKAEELAKSMETKFGLSWKWAGNTINFEAPSGAAKGTKGEVAVTDKSVRVAIDLPFFALSKEERKQTLRLKVLAHPDAGARN